MYTGQIWWELLSEEFLESFEDKREVAGTPPLKINMDLRLLEAQASCIYAKYRAKVDNEADVRASLVDMVGSIISVIEKIDSDISE